MKVRQYALTYPQLIAQAINAGLTVSEIQQLCQCHRLALRFSDGVYRAQDVPLLNHLVRTSSILLAADLSLPVVLAGLLHAVYTVHRFDNASRSSPGRTSRKVILDIGGKETQALLQEYGLVRWYTIPVLRAHLDQLEYYPENTRQVLKIRLANELEDRLDDATLFIKPMRPLNREPEYVAACVSLAEHLKLHNVAAELSQSLQINHSVKARQEVQINQHQAYELPVRRLWQANLATRMIRRLSRYARKSFIRLRSV